MSPLFTLLGWVVDATVKSSVLIVLVAVAQLAIGNRIAARWRHALWLLVILRLLVPVAPSSRWSVFNLLPSENSVRIAAADGTVVQARHARPTVVAAASEPIERPTIATIWRWALAIWIIGAIAVLLRASIAAARLHFAIRRRRQAAALHSGLALIECDLVATPALHGLFRPLLLLPENFRESFGDDELRHVVMHELWHLRRHDVAVNWLLTAVGAIHWFNPFVWFAASRLREERELACDELTLSCLEEEERRGYGRTILKLVECFRTATPIPALVGIVNHKKKMKRRILMIASYTNRTRVPLLFVAALALVGLAGFTDARGTERHTMMKKLDPAAMATVQKMGETRISLDVENASFGELLNTVTNATGITITQSPEAAASTVQQAKFTIRATNIPAAVLLHSSLLPFHLVPTPEANGVTIYQAAEGEGGEQHMEFHHEMAGHGEGAGEGVNSMKKTITMRVMDDSKSTVNADGSLHREVKVDIEENGVPSPGTLVLDIDGAPVQQ